MRFFKFINGVLRQLTGHEAIMTDNVTQTFYVTIRSLNGVGKGELRDLIQTKYEVVGKIEIEDTRVLARSGWFG